MSYIRQKRIGNNSYAYEQESYRDSSGQVHTRHIRYVGNSSGLGTTKQYYFDKRIDETPKIVAIEKEMSNKKKLGTTKYDRNKPNKYQVMKGEFGKNEKNIKKANVKILGTTDNGETIQVRDKSTNARSVYMPKESWPKKQFDNIRFTGYTIYKRKKYYGLD